MTGSIHASLGWSARLLTVAGLGVDAGIHLDLAGAQHPAGQSGMWSQVDLFLAEGAVAILAALVVLISAHRLAYCFAFLMAATALGAVLLYRYVNVGPLGPLPNMYEPFWYTSKVSTTVAEAVAVVSSTVGVFLPKRVSPPQYKLTPSKRAAV